MVRCNSVSSTVNWRQQSVLLHRLELIHMKHLNRHQPMVNSQQIYIFLMIEESKFSQSFIWKLCSIWKLLAWRELTYWLLHPSKPRNPRSNIPGQTVSAVHGVGSLLPQRPPLQFWQHWLLGRSCTTLQRLGFETWCYDLPIISITTTLLLRFSLLQICGTLTQILPHYNGLQRKHFGWTEAQSQIMKEYSFITH